MLPIWTADEVARSLALSRHQPFLRWLLITTVSLAAFAVGWHLGMPQRVYASDVSYLSVVITLLYFGFTGHCAYRTFQLSRELDAAARVSQLIEETPAPRFSLAGGEVRAGAVALPRCILSSLIGELVRMRDAGRNPAAGFARSDLLDAYANQIRAGGDTGWFVADTMIKLGLLGTGIGFVILLNAVTSVTDLDITSMKEVLVSMSGGMGVKLYTTVSGLVAAIMLGLQYQLLDRGADDLIALITRVVEVQVAPRLGADSQAA